MHDLSFLTVSIDDQPCSLHVRSDGNLRDLLESLSQQEAFSYLEAVFDVPFFYVHTQRRLFQANLLALPWAMRGTIYTPWGLHQVYDAEVFRILEKAFSKRSLRACPQCMPLIEAFLIWRLFDRNLIHDRDFSFLYEKSTCMCLSFSFVEEIYLSLQKMPRWGN